MSACQPLAESQDLRNSQILSKLLALVDPVPGVGGWTNVLSSGFLVTMLGLGKKMVKYFQETVLNEGSN